MCILCVVQKWSRRIATMLPWLVIPLIGLWALSQLLPPGFRFEITSPRLACVLVLLVTLFWYEILMPQLSAWRARRSARLRERRLFEAMEMQKLRKTATRRCRNCLTPYRDQKPGGGRFMCSYCGHISKRPVLDIPGSAALSNNGFFGDLVGKGGKIWNGKAWSENGWNCNQDWSENGSWVPGLSSSCRRNENPFFSGEDRCFAKNSYSGVVVFACKMLASFFMSIEWLWRKIFRVGSAREDALSDNEHKGHLLRKGQNGVNDSESRGEKARRKAEEKRQARLERELLEEEEKKQREEVARLVEERRRIRDEKLEADKECSKGLANSEKEQDNRRETVKRNQEKKKDKDKGSSKSNSDCEELEKKVRRESEKKREFDKRGEVERRDSHKTVRENFRVHGPEAGHGIKGTGNTFVRGNAVGNRYFDRMKGSFLSSSKAFNGANFFGRAAHTSSTPVAKVNKLSSGFGDHVQASTNRKEVHSAEPMTGKFTSNGDHNPETTTHQHVGPDLQPRPTVPKKSWQQLFTRSSSSDANMVSQLNQSQHIEVKSPTMPGQTSSSFYMDNQIHFGQSLPFNVSPLSSGSMSSSSAFSTKAEPQFPFGGESHHDFMHEEAELFEDPCYVPDPMSLLGPVSESLDNFPLDLGTGFLPSAGLERSHVLKTVSSVAEVNRPSPIESPLSRLRVAEERRITSSRLRSTPQTWGPLTTPKDESSNIHEEGTWQMWGTPPLGQDGLGLVGGPVSWLLPLGQNKPNVEDSAYAAASHKPMLSQIEKDYRVIPGVSSPQNVHLGIGQNDGTFSPIGSGLNDSDIWLQKSVGQPFLGDKEIHFPPLNAKEDLSCKEMLYDGSSGSERNQLFEPSPGNCWSKRDWVGDGQGECVGNSTQAVPGLESLFSSQDVESLWSFN